jgi:uncharacterized protein
MKIGVISDTHIPANAKEVPPQILQAFAHVDAVIHTGDLAELSVLKALKGACKEVHAVWGNMDPQEVRNQLPEKEVMVVGKHRIGIMHGQGAPANLPGLLLDVFKQEHVDVIVFGHSHSPLNEVRNGILLFNPGSATDKVYAPFNSYGILEVGERIEGKIVKI